MISISKIKVPLLFPGFLVYVVKFGQVLVIYVKNLATSTIRINIETLDK